MKLFSILMLALVSSNVFAGESIYTHVMPMNCQVYESSQSKIDNRLNYALNKYQAVGTGAMACQVHIPFHYEPGDTALIRIKEFGILHSDPDASKPDHNVSAFLFSQNHNSWNSVLKAVVSSSNTNSSAMTWTTVYPDNMTSSILMPLYMIVHIKRSAGNLYPSFRHARVVIEYVPASNAMVKAAETASIAYPEEAAEIAREVDFPEYEAYQQSISGQFLPIPLFKK